MSYMGRPACLRVVDPPPPPPPYGGKVCIHASWGLETRIVLKCEFHWRGELHGKSNVRVVKPPTSRVWEQLCTPDLEGRKQRVESRCLPQQREPPQATKNRFLPEKPSAGRWLIKSISQCRVLMTEDQVWMGHAPPYSQFNMGFTRLDIRCEWGMPLPTPNSTWVSLGLTSGVNGACPSLLPIQHGFH